MSKIFGFNDFNTDYEKKFITGKSDVTKSKAFGFNDFNTDKLDKNSDTSYKKPNLGINPVKKKSVSDLHSDENDQDYLLALQLQIQFQNNDSDEDVNTLESKHTSPVRSNTFHPKFLSPQKPLKSDDLGNPEYDLIDPCPDIRALFQEYDRKYFWNTLGSCIVEWSKRMTICAGIFYLRGGGTIRLSEPLLQYRPRKNLVETLLHEMIHAYLYLTRNFKDRDGHGDEFKSHMRRINALANTNITVYHTFHDEVNHARQHVWRCNGACRTMKPFFGYVKRSMNRAPSKNDRWWADHQSKCQGTFEKISEPDSFKQKMLKKSENGTKKSVKHENTMEIKAGVLKVKKKSFLSNSSSQPSTSSKSIESFFKPSQTQKSIDTLPFTKIKEQGSPLKKQSQSNLKEFRIPMKSPIKAIDMQSFKSPIKSPIKTIDIKPIKSQTKIFDIKKRKSDELVDHIDDDIQLIEENFSKKIKPILNNDIIVLDDDIPLSCRETSECPVCGESFFTDIINSHVNSHF